MGIMNLFLSDYPYFLLLFHKASLMETTFIVKKVYFSYNIHNTFTYRGNNQKFYYKIHIALEQMACYNIQKLKEAEMSGSVLGNTFKISTWGESHGKALGVVIDGCPAGLPLKEEDIQTYLNRRRPGQSAFSTPRSEEDKVEILSGVFEDITTGTPISLMVRNTSQRSADYSEISNYYRPGHADFTFDAKYGFRDYRGGGRSSGRETIGRVATGAVASKVLGELGIQICAYTKSIGSIAIDSSHFDREEIMNNALYMPDKSAAVQAAELINEKKAQGDSIGGIIECVITGVPAGLGDPVFDKLDANLAKSLLSIGAVKAFEIGDGFLAAEACGSQHNDSFRQVNGHIMKTSNHSGGTLGGISDGGDIVIRAYIKPTPSINKDQIALTKDGEEISVSIRGRHDPVIVPRAVVVVESMAAITLMDLLLSNMGAKMDHIKKIYND